MLLDSLETAIFSSLIIGLTEHSLNKKNENISRDMVLQFISSGVIDYYDRCYDMKVNYLISPLMNGLVYAILQSFVGDKNFLFAFMTSTLSMTTALVSINQLKIKK